MIYLDLRVTALSDEEMGGFLRLCAALQACAIRGASRTITVHIDGDGSGRVKFCPIVNGEAQDNLPWSKIDVDNIQPIHIGE